MLENEEKLVNRAKKDKKAFGKLYEYYWPKVVRYLQNKVNGNLQTAEDLASTTFEKALKNISSYKWLKQKRAIQPQLKLFLLMLNLRQHRR